MSEPSLGHYVSTLQTGRNRRSLFRKIRGQKYLFLMSAPFVVWVIIFAYIPLWGWTMAFQDFKVSQPLFHQQWVGLANFATLFKDPGFYEALQNTLAMSFLNLTFGFCLPIVFALILNEVRSMAFKRTIQSVTYLPHFVSWVVVAALFNNLLSMEGPVNQGLLKLGLVHQPLLLFAKPNLFWGLLTSISIWKEIGWNSILFLAAMAGVDPQLYEAAGMDGAGRFRRIWHVTLPGIRNTILIVFVMCVGWLINIGLDAQYQLSNPLVEKRAMVLDWYALRYGIQSMRYSFGTAVGMLKSVVSLVLIFIANRTLKRVNEGRGLM